MVRLAARRLASTSMAYWALMGVALFPLMSIGYMGMLAFQQSNVPIVDRFEVDTAVVDEQGDVTISGSFYKLFPARVCEFTDARFYMPDIAPDGSRVERRIERVFGDKRKTEADNNRPKGYTEFFDWKLFTSEYPELDEYSGFATHDCLGFFPARTDFPTYKLLE